MSNLITIGRAAEDYKIDRSILEELIKKEGIMISYAWWVPRIDSNMLEKFLREARKKRNRKILLVTFVIAAIIVKFLTG